MRQKPVYIVDEIRNLVTATNTAVIAELQAYSPLITGITFIPGTEGEINEVLTLMSQQGGSVWPLFGLLMSFKESVGRETGIDTEADLNILIARRGNNTDKTPARMDNNFKPVLMPIYLEFLNQIYLSGRYIVSTPDRIPHDRWIFPYYDADKGVNVFNSYIDAIQIKIKLKIKVAASWRC